MNSKSNCFVLRRKLLALAIFIFSINGILISKIAFGADIQSLSCTQDEQHAKGEIACNFIPQGDETLEAVNFIGNSKADIRIERAETAERWGDVLVVVDNSVPKNDTSFQTIRALAAEIVRTTEPYNATAVLRYGDRAEWLSDFSATGVVDIETVEAWARPDQKRFFAADAMERAIDALRERPDRNFQEIVIITDGFDETPEAIDALVLSRIVEKANAANIRISAVGLPYSEATDLAERLAVVREAVRSTGGLYQQLEMKILDPAGRERRIEDVGAALKRRMEARARIFVQPPENWDGTPVLLEPVILKSETGSSENRIRGNVVQQQLMFPERFIAQPEPVVVPEPDPEPVPVIEEPKVEDPGLPSWLIPALAIGGVALLLLGLLVKAMRKRNEDEGGDDDDLFGGAAAAALPEGRLNGTLVVIGNEEDVFEVRSDKFSIGRGSENDLRLNNESVSRQHCIILRHRDGYMAVQDHGSLNGVRLNGEPVNGVTSIEDGAIIELGEVRLKFASNKSRQKQSGEKG